MDKKKPIIVIASIILFLIILFCMTGGNDTITVTQPGGTPVTIETGRPNLNVFLENSGSMDGYMIPGSELKDAIYSYISDLQPECDTVNLYYINSQIIKRPDDIASYIKDLTPQNFAQCGGSRANTDVGNVIKNVLINTPDSTVSILISDFILDLPSNDADKYLTNMSIQIKNEINKKLKEDPNFAVVILQMESQFSGKYYYPNGTAEDIEGKRPYYIWMFGNKNYLTQLKRDVPYSKIKHGYKNYVAFSNTTDVPYEISNTNMTGNRITAKNGSYEILIRADFSPTLQPNVIIENIQNYKTIAPATKISEVTQITAENSPYTHCIKVNTESGTLVNQEEILFSAPHMPAWIEAANDESASDVTKSMDKTTGIRSLIEGVADAYDKYKISTSFKFNMSNKKR